MAQDTKEPVPWYVFVLGALGAPSVLSLAHNAVELRGHVLELIHAWTTVTQPVREILNVSLSRFLPVDITLLAFNAASLIAIVAICTLRAEFVSGTLKGDAKHVMGNVFFYTVAIVFAPFSVLLILSRANSFLVWYVPLAILLLAGTMVLVCGTNWKRWLIALSPFVWAIVIVSISYAAFFISGDGA